MSDEQAGELAFGSEVQDEPQDARPDRHVKHRNWLIGNHELRLEDHRRRDGDALPLPARELVREAAGELVGRGESHRSECPSHERAALLGTLADAVDQERFGDDLLHSLAWIERLVGVLEDQLEAPPESPQFGARQASDVAAVVDDLTGCRRNKAHQRMGYRRLAAARLTHQGQDLARQQVERHAVHRSYRAAPAGQVPRGA